MANTPEVESENTLYKTDEFRMYCFKVLPCSKRFCHDWIVCSFAHPGEKARRRDPRVYHYTGIACPEMKTGKHCPRGSACPFAHNVFEYWLHPTRYRTQPCKDGSACSRKVCFFAHTLEELRVPSSEEGKAAASDGQESDPEWQEPDGDINALISEELEIWNHTTPPDTDSEQPRNASSSDKNMSDGGSSQESSCTYVNENISCENTGLNPAALGSTRKTLRKGKGLGDSGGKKMSRYSFCGDSDALGVLTDSMNSLDLSRPAGARREMVADKAPKQEAGIPFHDRSDDVIGLRNCGSGILNSYGTPAPPQILKNTVAQMGSTLLPGRAAFPLNPVDPFSAATINQQHVNDVILPLMRSCSEAAPQNVHVIAENLRMRNLAGSVAVNTTPLQLNQSLNSTVDIDNYVTGLSGIYTPQCEILSMKDPRLNEVGMGDKSYNLASRLNGHGSGAPQF